MLPNVWWLGALGGVAAKKWGLGPQLPIVWAMGGWAAGVQQVEPLGQGLAWGLCCKKMCDSPNYLGKNPLWLLPAQLWLSHMVLHVAKTRHA